MGPVECRPVRLFWDETARQTFANSRPSSVGAILRVRQITWSHSTYMRSQVRNLRGLQQLPFSRAELRRKFKTWSATAAGCSCWTQCPALSTKVQPLMSVHALDCIASSAPGLW